MNTSESKRKTTISRRLTRSKRTTSKVKTISRRAGGASKAMSLYRERGPETVYSRVSITPDRTFVKLRYMEPPYLTGNLTGGTLYVDKYSLNSIYDPYLGVGGGQPSGTARMFAQYSFCRVWASTIKFHVTRVEHQSDSPYEIALVPISPGGTASPPTTLATYVEQPYAKYREGVSVYADQPHTLSMRMETSKVCGVTPAGLLQVGFYHNSAANAQYNAEWHCVLLQSNAIVSNTALQISVEIEYECEFFLRTSNPASLLDKVVDDSIDTGRIEIIKKELSGEVKVTPHLRDESKEILPDDIVIMAPIRPPVRTLSSVPVISNIVPSKKPQTALKINTAICA